MYMYRACLTHRHERHTRAKSLATFQQRPERQASLHESIQAVCVWTNIGKAFEDALQEGHYLHIEGCRGCVDALYEGHYSNNGVCRGLEDALTLLVFGAYYCGTGHATWLGCGSLHQPRVAAVQVPHLTPATHIHTHKYLLTYTNVHIHTHNTHTHTPAVTIAVRYD